MHEKGNDYDPYIDFVNKLHQKEELFLTFRREPVYMDMMEHVTFIHGAVCLYQSQTLFNVKMKDVEEYCDLNDRYGMPLRFQYSPTLNCSPTSLRYIFHALLVINRLKMLSIREVSFVEVGGGYGGLFLALQFFAAKEGIRILKYSLIDLKPAMELQKKYLSKHTCNVPVTFHDAANFGSDVQGKDLFFISCYSFSEICKEYQQKYIANLFPKCKSGFLVWNMIDLYDFGKQVSFTDEMPQTGYTNKFVFF